MTRPRILRLPTPAGADHAQLVEQGPVPQTETGTVRCDINGIPAFILRTDKINACLAGHPPGSNVPRGDMRRLTSAHREAEGAARSTVRKAATFW